MTAPTQKIKMPCLVVEGEEGEEVQSLIEKLELDQGVVFVKYLQQRLLFSPYKCDTITNFSPI